MTQTQECSALNADLVNAIIKSTCDVLLTMANTSVTFKEVMAETEYHPHGDISAIIGIIGEDGEGMFTISFSLRLANIILARLLGTTPETLNTDDRCDGVGELVNMITGNAKAMLSSKNNMIYKLSLPTVVLGAKHELIHRPRNTPLLVLSFETEGEIFQLKVSFKKSSS